MPGKAAIALADGHFIVIENDYHRFPAHGKVVEGLINHAAGGRTVSHQGNHIVIFPQEGTGPGHAKRNGNGTGSVTGHKGIRHTLRRLGESGNPPELPQTVKTRLASRQQLMNIRLMTHIKNQAVLFRIINRFNGYRQLNHAQVASQMAPGLRYMVDEKFPDLPAETSPLRVCKL